MAGSKDDRYQVAVISGAPNGIGAALANAFFA
jgi:NADP-dependent 3-hydroxy acid dehydrogenase YdfG